MGREEERAVAGASKIRWHTNHETRYPFGERSPDPEWFEPIGFPPPWPDRPWTYGVVVASANGVLAWRRADTSDDPVLAVLGGDESRLRRVHGGVAVVGNRQHGPGGDLHQRGP